MIQGFDSDSVPGTRPARADAPADREHERGRRRSRDFWWLPPALLLVAFGLLIWQVKTNGPVTHLDVNVRARLQDAARSPSMAWAFHPGRAMADLGNETFTLVVLFAVTALAVRTARSWRPALISLGAVATLGTVILLKIWIHRPGPGTAVFGDASLGFFPSGHTADAVLSYGTSALLLCVFVIPDSRLNADARRSRQAIIAAAIILIVLTIAGLLWSNFHWLSDTVGSLCWCGAALAVLYHYATSNGRVKGLPEKSEKRPRPV